MTFALIIVLLYRYTTLSGFMAAILTVLCVKFPLSVGILFVLMLLPKDELFEEKKDE